MPATRVNTASPASRTRSCISLLNTPLRTPASPSSLSSSPSPRRARMGEQHSRLYPITVGLGLEGTKAEKSSQVERGITEQLSFFSPHPSPDQSLALQATLTRPPKGGGYSGRISQYSRTSHHLSGGMDPGTLAHQNTKKGIPGESVDRFSWFSVRVVRAPSGNIKFSPQGSETIEMALQQAFGHRSTWE
ncbi:hypothetical protein B0H16DRAFT_1456788 [Mycena metata]|uniref:Uncharacterized protein n=1 Tax=Mycena metata TaxID=1033252 RepID=A0AAD7J8H5_9AGAR|nr:hypothetical protein B0H16DRAFT_1456788 [Mycena metata]